MAKKETLTKSFVLRVDAVTMDAIEKWAADEFRSIAEALRKNGRVNKSKSAPHLDLETQECED